MKMYYIANARMPSEKAHGIQIAKMCEAFIVRGVSVELVVSSRGTGDVSTFYGLQDKIPVRRLPVLDLQFLGSIGYRLTALQFVIGSLAYLWWKVLAGEQFVIYAVDMDVFSFAPLAWLPRPVYAEMHSPKPRGVLRNIFFKKANIIATNELIAAELQKIFDIPDSRLRIEPNGVDATQLEHRVSRDEARRTLELGDKSFALYVGHIYAWKGLEILADAAAQSTVPIYVVGGTRDEYEKVTRKSGAKLHFIGVRSVSEVPIWLAAADVLLVLGTAQNEDSYRYTSPMKVFEYLAAKRPVVASRTPALASIVRDDVVHWYAPDDAASLAGAIRETSVASDDSEKIASGYALASTHTWARRAQRILDWMQFGQKDMRVASRL